ncbi:hypothetical protein Tco_1031407 [Tanacetum coccineum]|uniref:Uncharacterized protein n=1 Tax=Tanacetum coccineum TaxID=301880 RepID=A0ABQ5G8W7_9ASTR
MKDDGDSTKTRMGKIEKSKEELEMFKALEHKSIVMELNKHKMAKVQLNLAYPDRYITEEMLGKLGFVRLDNDEYGRKMVTVEAS